MANGGGSLQQFCKDIKCSKCSQYPAVPKTLSCLHTFCRGCLANLMDAEKEQLHCRDCKNTLQIPVDVDRLDTNFCFENFLYYARKDRETASGRRAAHCGRCSRTERTSVNTFCTVCRMDLCDLCTTDRRAVPATSGHPLTAKVANGSQHGRWFCSKHKDEVNSETLAEVQYYCSRCEKVICNTCIVTGDHEHTGMTTTAIDAYRSQDHRQQIERSSTKAEEVKDLLVTAVGRLEDLKCGAATSLENAKKEIEEKVRQLHEMLDEEGRRMKEKAAEFFTEKTVDLDKQIQELSEIQDKFEHSQKITQGVLTVGEAEDILFMKRQLVSRLDGLSQTYQNHNCKPRVDDVIQFTENARTERTRAHFRNAIGAVSPEFFIPDLKDRVVDDQYFASQL